MSCAAAHCADDEPVAAGTCILIYGLGKMSAFVLGGVETESGGIAGKRKVVVDGLGDVDVADGILLGLKEFGDAVGRRSGVVSTNGDKELDVVVLEQGQVEILLEV